MNIQCGIVVSIYLFKNSYSILFIYVLLKFKLIGISALDALEVARELGMITRRGTFFLLIFLWFSDVWEDTEEVPVNSDAAWLPFS